MKLSDVCHTSAGGTPLKSVDEYYTDGDVPWLLSGEVNKKNITNCEKFITQAGLKNSSAKIFPPGTVLVAMYGATAGQVGILRIAAATNQAVCGILPNESVFPDFLYYFLLSQKRLLVSQAVGNAQPNISQQKVRNLRLALPTINEQKRIASALDEAYLEIDKVREITEEKLVMLNQLKQSILSDLLLGLSRGRESSIIKN